MKEEIIKKLVDINDRFYQNFGAAFAETRRRIQPGVQKIADQYMTAGDWLDLGCGSGALGQRLAQSEHQGRYVGLDFSTPLLENAKTNEPGKGFELKYEKANLYDEHWAEVVQGSTFDGITAFAVFHHIPGAELRRRVIRQALGLLKPGGVFIHSEWQFQNSQKLLARVQPWSLAGLADSDVENGDVLLDWRHLAAGQTDEVGLRYVHLFSSEELHSIASAEKFNIVDEFLSDGAGGNLGLYQVWKK